MIVDKSGNVRIEMTDHGKGRIFIDGIELSSLVLSVKYSAAPLEPNTLTLTLCPKEVVIEGPADIYEEIANG